MDKWGEEPTGKEGGQYRRRRRDEGQIIRRLFDKASRNHNILYLLKLCTM